MANELTCLGFTTVSVDPAVTGYGAPWLSHQWLVREHALPVAMPFVAILPGSLRFRVEAKLSPINRLSRIRETGWGMYRGSATLPSVMGKLLLTRFRAGRPVTLIRGLTAEAVLAWGEDDLEPLSAHQRQAIRCAAMAACEGYGPFIVAIDIDDERSFLRVEAESQFFPLDRSYFVWAATPPEQHDR
ncbi:hypothetical protein [Methylorubrum sp. GM97]|uniref:hypothetical protein n=1 Tax=Methylorubrum sp. GM97 TaxID=2938232 RepID=UPI0021C2DF7B|nr:hypothetical protein [Methylorubrum sp. GM97]